MKKLLLVLLAACGGDDTPVTPGDGEASHLALTLPATLAPGEPLPVAWTVAGATDNDRVVLHVFRPGRPLVSTSAGYRFTGSAPATVYAGTVAPDGSLSPTDVAVAIPAASGQVAIPLPASSDGDWNVTAKLVRGDTTVDLASATTWVASPANALRLDISRTWARGDDLVRVGVRTLPSTDALRLSAWLTLPDGTITSLPGVSAQYVPAAEGVLPAALPPLLLQKLGAHGPGRYLVSARLETLDGEERGSAGAMIQVCEEPGAITGTVAGDRAGTPVVAFNAVDRSTASGEVAPDGSFSLAVPPGQWLLIGGAVAPVEVGCGQTIAVDLTAARRRGKPVVGSPVHHDVPLFGGVRFVVRTAPPRTSRISDSDVEAVANQVAFAVMQGRSGFTALTFHDFEQLAGVAMMGQQMGQDDGGVQADELEERRKSPDFFVTITVLQVGDTLDANLVLTDAHTGMRLPGGDVDVVADTISAILDGVKAKVDKMLGDADSLRARVDGTDAPTLAPLWASIIALPGDTAAGTIHVFDTDGSGIAGLTIDARIAPGPTGSVVDQSTVTDSGGLAHVTYTVPTTNPPRYVMLSATHTRKSGAIIDGPAQPLTIQPRESAIQMQKPVLRTNGDRTSVIITMPPAANRLGRAVANGLTIDGNDEVRFDANGRARFDVVTDTRSGPTEVDVTLTPSPVAHADPMGDVPAIAYGYVVKPLDLNAFVEPKSSTITGELLEVRGVVSLQGVPLSSVPVAFELIGEGSIGVSAITDASGRFDAFYRAPSTGAGSTTIKLTVVKDADVTEKTLTVTYAPPCMDCPILIEGLGNIPRGGTTLLVANQKVTWTASRGTISPDGQYTGPGLGGTSRVTATSATNPASTKVFSLVEACLYQEVVLNGVLFHGDVTALAPWNPALFDTSCLKVKISLADSGPMVGALINTHQQDCGAVHGLAGSIAFRGPDLASCTIGFSEFGQCGQLSDVVLSPDPNTDGMDSRSYSSFVAHDDLANPGLCKIDYSAQGTVTRN